jgi:hypothetical protein
MDSSEIEKRRRAYEREDRVYDLQPSEAEKRELLYETEEKLWKLIKNKLWWSTVIVGVFGVLGVLGGVLGVPLLIHTLVERAVERVAATPLNETKKEYAQAHLMAELAKKGASDAMDAAGQAKTQVQDLTSRAAGVEERYGLLTERINAEWKNATLRSTDQFKAAQERISRLEALVKKIGAENEDSRKAYADYKKQIDEITAETAKSQQRFAENSQYTVLISYSSEQRPLAQKVQSALANKGFKAQLLPLGAPGPIDPATGELSTGNSLTYSPESEMKAQEILTLIKSFIKDVRLRLREPPKIPSVPGRPTPPPAEIFKNQFFITLGS